MLLEQRKDGPAGCGKSPWTTYNGKIRESLFSRALELLSLADSRQRARFLSCCRKASD
jgi:hypothetical protein